MRRRGPTSKAPESAFVEERNHSNASSPPSLLSTERHSQNPIVQKPLLERHHNSALAVSKPVGALAQVNLTRQPQISVYPRALDSSETLLLSHYIDRFSRQYPTCSGPRNPFLSVFVPMAMKCTMVLDSLLALSGAQRWQHGSTCMEDQSLRLRQRALKGARDLLSTESESFNGVNSVALCSNGHGTDHRAQPASLIPGVSSVGDENLIFLLTSSILFLLYEKVSGETTWKPHMDFLNQFFERSLPSIMVDVEASSEVVEAVRFLHDVFVYNDLVRATSTNTKPLSNFYLSALTRTEINCGPLGAALFPTRTAEQAEFRRRYYFPNLIARLCSGDHSVTEEDIAAWDGNMDWLPSFALEHTTPHPPSSSSAESHDRSIARNDHMIIAELYRTAADIYRLQVLRHQSWLYARPISGRTELQHSVKPQLAVYAHLLVTSLPEGSTYENALLWPIGIAAKELTNHQITERSNILLRLRRLETRFQMRHFKKVRDLLVRHWAQRDIGVDPNGPLSGDDAILLG